VHSSLKASPNDVFSEDEVNSFEVATGVIGCLFKWCRAESLIAAHKLARIEKAGDAVKRNRWPKSM
jgi:hypothetical protein